MIAVGTDKTAAPRAARPVDVLLHVAAIRPSEARRVVSCYVPLGPAERSARTYLTRAKSRIHDLRTRLDTLVANREARLAAERDFGRLVDYLSRPVNLPGTRGLALFLCEPLDLFAVVPLPAVYRFQLILDRTAHVRTLEAVAEQFGRILTAVVDRKQARVFEVTAFEAREVACLTANASRGRRFHGARRNAPGWGERTYHNRIRTEKERHFSAVAETLAEKARVGATRGCVLAAQGPTSQAVMQFLPPAVAGRFLGSMSLNPSTVTAAEVYEATTRVAAADEARAVAAAVADVREGLGTGWAVEGVRETLRALFEGKVRTLLVADAVAVPGFRCSHSGRLVLDAGECRSDGTAEPAPYLIDDAVEEALRQHVQVVTVSDDAPPIDGLAGLLRFR